MSNTYYNVTANEIVVTYKNGCGDYMRWKNTGIIIGIIIGVYVFMKYLLPVLSPFLVGWILSLIVYPLAVKISSYPFAQKLRLSKDVMGCALILILVGIVFLILWGLMALCMDQVPGWVAAVPAIEDGFNGILEDCCSTIERATGILAQDSKVYLQGQIESIVKALDGNRLQIMNQAAGSMKKCIVIVSGIMLSIISAILFIKDLDVFKNALEPFSLYRKIRHVLLEMVKAVRMYLKAQLRIMGIVILLCILGFYLLGNKSFLLWGICAGILDALPVLGTGIVLIPWAISMLIQGKTTLALGYLLLYIVCSCTRQFLEPKWIGKELGVYPIVILAAIYLGIVVYGGMGFILGPASALLIRGLLKEWGVFRENL